MSSLHARRPPKLEQGDLRRNKQRGAGGHAPIKPGGGSLRRPHNANAAGADVSSGHGGGNGSEKKKCRTWRMITSVLVVVLLTYLFMQVRVRDMFGGWFMKNSGSGLRANQNAEPLLANLDAKPG